MSSAPTRKFPRNELVCRAVHKVHDQVQASAQKNLPIIWSEYNASYKNEPEVTDAVFMGPWLADTIRQCDGLVAMMSYWTFSDVFEEQGVVKQPFYGGYGLLAEDGLPKPSFNAFKMLHAPRDHEACSRFAVGIGHEARGRHRRHGRLEFVSTGYQRGKQTSDDCVQRRRGKAQRGDFSS